MLGGRAQAAEDYQNSVGIQSAGPPTDVIGHVARGVGPEGHPQKEENPGVLRGSGPGILQIALGKLGYGVIYKGDGAKWADAHKGVQHQQDLIPAYTHHLVDLIQGVQLGLLQLIVITSGGRLQRIEVVGATVIISINLIMTILVRNFRGVIPATFQLPLITILIHIGGILGVIWFVYVILSLSFWDVIAIVNAITVVYVVTIFHVVAVV